MTTRRNGVGGRGTWWLALGAWSLAAGAAPAQCAQWAPGEGYPSVAGPNLSRYPTFVADLVSWDPDAGGPQSPVLVVYGSFSIAGGALVSDHAVYDPATGVWASGSTALNPNGITAQATLPNGDEVIARGSTVERWNGTAWAPLGITMNGTVRALVGLSTGDVVAGGDFTTADGIVVNHVSRWDGAAWLPMGSGMDAPVRALTAVAGGAVFAGGAFTTAGGGSASNIALWDGIAWSALGAGTNGTVQAQAILSTGELVAAGSFTLAGGASANRIAAWDGTAWSALGSGLNGTVQKLFSPPNGDLLVQGTFTLAGGVGADTIARWDGTAWSSLGDIAPLPGKLVMLPDGTLVTGGEGYFPGFGSASDDVAVQRWDGSAWRPLGAGIDREVRALAQFGCGDLVVGGSFTQVGTLPANRIARWDGAAWSPLDVGVDDTVHALCVRPDGDVIAGGAFTTAGGVAADHIARWDGAMWLPLGAGMDGAVRALTTDAGGDLIAGGDFTTAGLFAAARIARWNGTMWLPLAGGVDGPVRALATLPNGDLVAGGAFTTADGLAANHVARWDGTSWAPLGTGTNGTVQSLLVLAGGDLIAGGSFTTAGGVGALHVARWDGTAWSAVGAPALAFGNGVSSLAAMPDGDLVLADYDFGFWVPGQPSSRLLRWDGSTWTQFGTPNGQVHALLSSPRGELAVGGAFTAVGGAVSAFFARYVSTCPATATAFGVGCPSSGGDNTLVATTLPWVDATFHATATGLPDPAVVVAVIGFLPIAQGALPLASLLAEGVPGCDVLVDPLALVPLTADAGVATTAIFLPNTPPLVGVAFREQMIPFELDGLGGFVAVTATNALELVAGDF